LLYNNFLGALFTLLAAHPIVIKIILSFIIIAPLALGMGMCFPLGITHFCLKNKNYIPWAWGINGCASVISAVLASLLAIQFGFKLLILFALCLYLLSLLLINIKSKTMFDPQ
jgi:hypothetical protein